MTKTAELSILGMKLSQMWDHRLLRCGYRGQICGLALRPVVQDKHMSPYLGECLMKLEGKCTKSGASPRITPRFRKGKKK